MEADLPSTKRHDQWEDVCHVTNKTYDDENHKGSIASYRRHEKYEGRGQAVGAWKNRRLAQSSALRCGTAAPQTVWWCSKGHTTYGGHGSLIIPHPRCVLPGANA